MPRVMDNATEMMPVKDEKKARKYINELHGLDDKTKVFRYQLQKKDGSFSNHTNKFNYQDKDYYSTKEMKGKEKGNFTKLMNEINKNFTDFQIGEV